MQIKTLTQVAQANDNQVKTNHITEIGKVAETVKYTAIKTMVVDEISKIVRDSKSTEVMSHGNTIITAISKSYGGNLSRFSRGLKTLMSVAVRRPL